MTKQLIALALLGTLGISILAVNVAVWLSPRAWPGGLAMKLGSVVADFGVLMVVLSAVFLQPRFVRSYMDVPPGRPDLETGFMVSLTIVGAGLLVLVYGLRRSRLARPVVPADPPP